jgi:MFS family permease
MMLWALYFVEGMPWGFQSKALPSYLRQRHATLTEIGLLSALSLPWMFKVSWAPFIDLHGSARFGRRKSWIVPTQGLVALACFGAAAAVSGERIVGLLALILCMNFFSATMDIAVDGLAVDLLSTRELGTGNTAQVVGYKLGALTSGGLFVWVADLCGWGWPMVFVAMGAVTLCVAVATSTFDENRHTQKAPEEPGRVIDETAGYREPGMREAPEPSSFMAIIRRVISASKVPGALAFFLVVGTYKTGEQLIDSMFRPFLIDHGFSAGQIALWVGIFGATASTLGSFVGGLAASRLPLYRALVVAAVLRAIPILGVFALTWTAPTRGLVITVDVAENFFGGLLTTVMFAYMMSRTDRKVGATHFTLLATVEMLGKAPVPFFAGVLGDRFGYRVLFSLATVFSFAFLALLPPLKRASIEAEK